MDEIESWLKETDESVHAYARTCIHTPAIEKLLSLVRVYRNELFSYSSGDELSELEEKAKEIING